VFDTFLGTEDGVVFLGRSARQLGLEGRRISAVHAFYGRSGDLIILAGTYGQGLFRSRDLGGTWDRVEGGMTAPAARMILPDPLQPGAILCGTEPARLFRSHDEGLTWVELSGIRDLPVHQEWYLPYSPRAGAVRNVLAPGDGRLLAAVEVGGLLESADGGATWSVAPVGPNDDIHQVSGHLQRPELVWTSLGYAALRSRRRETDAPPLGGVGRSRDGGRTWEVLHTHYTRSTIVPRARPDLVLAGPAPAVGRGGRIEVSRDQGDSWEPAGSGVPMPMPDMVEVFDQAPDGSVYALCSGGRLLRSEPDPWRWRSALPVSVPEKVVSVAFLAA
jgi:photosystem II stability/assembly factor-like uncharacterized protein